MLDYRVETFLAVCHCMNYTRAAEELHITQPAVSQQIRYLEQYYNTPLFTYCGKKLSITPAGLVLQKAAISLKNDDNAIMERINALQNKHKTIHFGATMTIGEFAISSALAKYLKCHPDVNIKLHIANTNSLLEELKNGTIQCAFIEGSFDQDSFDYSIFQTDPFIAVCSAKHQFLQTPKRLENLLGEHLLLREQGSGTRDIFQKSLVLQNLSLEHWEHISEINSMHIIIELLKKDIGISFLYKNAVSHELETGELKEIPLEDFRVEHDFTFLWSKNSVFSSEYKEFCEELK